MLRVTGTYQVHRYSSEGRYLGTMNFHNTVVPSGITMFLSALAGGTELLDGSASLQVRNSSDTLVQTVATTHTDPALDGALAEVVFQWMDDSPSTYDAASVSVLGSEGTEFSSASPALGTKPTDEAWLYEYTLSIGGGTDFDTDGLRAILSHVSGLTTTPLTDGKAYVEVFNSSGVSGGTKTYIGTPDLSGNSLSWEFVFGLTEANFSWGDVAFGYNDAGTSFVLRQGDDNIQGGSTKTSSEQWTYTFTLQVSDS